VVMGRSFPSGVHGEGLFPARESFRSIRPTSGNDALFCIFALIRAFMCRRGRVAKNCGGLSLIMSPHFNYCIFTALCETSTELGVCHFSCNNGVP